AATFIVAGVPTVSLALTAAEFQSGDHLLLVTNSGAKMTSVILTANPAVSGATVKFTFAATSASGANANDTLQIANASNSKLGKQFCGSDWIIRLARITYQVCAGPNSPAGC